MARPAQPGRRGGDQPVRSRPRRRKGRPRPDRRRHHPCPPRLEPTARAALRRPRPSRDAARAAEGPDRTEARRAQVRSVTMYAEPAHRRRVLTEALKQLTTEEIATAVENG